MSSSTRSQLALGLVRQHQRRQPGRGSSGEGRLRAKVIGALPYSLTPSQAQLLRRFTTRVVLSFDPDAAGQNAAARSCELLVAEGFDVNVVVLDRGEDPDVFIRTHGGEAYRERLRTSRPYLDYLLEQAAAEVALVFMAVAPE